jgi:hypothetical protein
MGNRNPKIFIPFILLFFFMNTCMFDPGWRYKVKDPHREDTYHHKYVYRSYPLSIELTANDFAYETFVELKITTPLDSVIIHPNFAYITSPHFINKKHFPTSIKIEYFSEDRIERKKINKDEFAKPYCLYEGDSLLANFTYPGFAIYSNNSRSAVEKSDFIFHYDIYNNKNPLTFNFKPPK